MIFCMKININIFYKLVVSVLLVIARHAESTQNKFAKSLQYLKNKVRYEPLSLWNPNKSFSSFDCLCCISSFLFQVTVALREKWPNMEFFWSVFSCIWTEYGNLRRKSLYSVQIRENTDQKIPYLDTFRTWNNYSQKFCKTLCWDHPGINFGKKNNWIVFPLSVYMYCNKQQQRLSLNCSKCLYSL